MSYVHSQRGLAEDDQERVHRRHSSHHLRTHGWAARHVDTERFSTNLQAAIDFAQIRGTLGAMDEGARSFRFSHGDVLLGLYLAENGQARQVLTGLGVDERGLRAEVREAKRELGEGIGSGSLMLEAVLHTATELAARRGYEKVGTEHLLYALTTCHGQNPAMLALAKFGITPDQIRQKVNIVSPDLHASSLAV
jgi:ATP-dependent Clp protease ATP-binding subunit ClpA